MQVQVARKAEEGKGKRLACLQALVGNDGVTDAVDADDAGFSADFPYLSAPGEESD